MKIAKRILSAVLAIVMVLSAVAMITGCKNQELTDGEKLELGLQNSIAAALPISAVKEVVNVDELLTKAITGKFVFDMSKFSMSTSFDGEKQETEIPEILKTAKFEATGVYQDKAASGNLSVTLGDKTYSADALFKDSKLALKLKEILGDQYYGVDFSTIAEKLKDSPLGTMIGITEEIELPKLDIDSENYKKIVEKLADYASKAFSKACTYEKVTETVKIDSTDVEVESMKYDFTTEKLVTAVREFVSLVKADTVLCTDINKAIEELNSLGAKGGMQGTGFNDDDDGEVSIPEKREKITVDTIAEEIEKACKELETKGFSANLKFCLKDEYVALIELSYTSDNETLSVAVNFGAGPEKSNKICIDIKAGDEINLSIAWVVDERTEESYKAHLEIKTSPLGNPSSGTEFGQIGMVDVTIKPLFFTYTNSSGDYGVTLDLTFANVGRIDVNGTIKATKDTIKLGFGSIRINEFSYSTLDYTTGESVTEITMDAQLELKFEKDAKEITVPAYKDILTLTKEEIGELMMKIQEFAATLGIPLGENKESPTPDFVY